MNSPWPDAYQALVVGASGAIGGALVQALQHDPRCARVLGLDRQHAPVIELRDEATLAQAARELAPQGPWHLIIDATGALQIDGHGPEKRMQDLQADRLMAQFHTNTIGPALLIKHLAPLLPMGQPCAYAKLSARVGSIEDNRKGGWWGYRSAKAALNMVLQCAAIELSRQRPQLRVLALQPGTVRSRLSQPFVGDQADPPEQAAAGLLRAIAQAPADGRAHFLDAKGLPIPW